MDLENCMAEISVYTCADYWGNTSYLV
ncbi:MAG TPA: hypothetical protein EYP60_05805 [bacterium (Candidatus Stahlbacteria)]|nr:hypothetical protein [Candidatus Stahlbacteria bacterium]